MEHREHRGTVGAGFSLSPLFCNVGILPALSWSAEASLRQAGLGQK